MKSICCVAGVALFVCSIAGFAEKNIPCNRTLSRPLPPRAVLIIDSKPAGLEIVGTDQDSIHVSCTAGSDEAAQAAAFYFSPMANGGKLSVRGIHFNHRDSGLQVKIEVPRRTNLSVRMFAGQVTVEEVKGDKDIDLGAGQITISAIHPSDYRSVDASVSIGEVQAGPYGSDKGGFFRRFRKSNANGDYRLQAHVTTGQIDLVGHADQDKPD